MADRFSQMIEESKKYDTCMALTVSEEGKSVELLLETGTGHYLDWIPGEGGDIGLLRDRETNRVVGVHLPLLNNKLVVQYRGPLRVNEGFLKDEQQ